MVSIRRLGLLLLGLTGMQSAAEGGIVFFDSKSDFLVMTGATSATGPLPELNSATPVTVGAITIESVSGNMSLTDWTARLPGNEVAVDGTEDLNLLVNLAEAVFALGFDFVEPELDPHINAPFLDSTFEVSLFDGAIFVDSFTFNTPNDAAAFVGVWGTASFDKIEVREIAGANENEFFGEVFAGTTPLETVPVDQIDWSTVKNLFRPQ